MMRRRTSRWLLRLAAAGTIVAALAYIPYRVCGSEGYVHYENMQAERGQLQSGNSRLIAENAALRSEVRRLRDDLDAVATVARDELGMVAPGEIVLRIATPPKAPR